MSARSWRRRLGPQVLVWGGLIVVGLLAAGLADARPGGGHSYSGGGSSYSGSSYSGSSGSSYSGSSYSGSSYSGSSGGGSGSGCEIVGTLLFAAIYGVGALLKAVTEGGGGFDSHAGSFSPAPAPPPKPRRIDWNLLWARDSSFSPVVFEDFVYQLYARVHEARSDPEAMASLAPYLVEGAREAIANRSPRGATISDVVIGSMQVTALRVDSEYTTIDVRFESNLTASSAVHGQRAEHEPRRTHWYLVESWELERVAGVTSKAPAEAVALKCPNCGAPFESTADQRCDYCGEIVANGRFDWHVTRTKLLLERRRPPPLGGYAPEVGTERPTLIAPSFAKRFEALLADDPKLTREAILARIGHVYERLNIAWVARDLSLARPYLSDGIHDYLRYWIEAYEQQGLINCLENMHIERIELVKLTRDSWYDALTVRLFASGLDYTIKQSDESVVGGSPTRPRRYSEYWTLIRGAGVRGEARDDSGCPNCGAPLTVSMAGNCEHCSAHLTQGEFDWVLSRIEQDESYLG